MKHGVYRIILFYYIEPPQVQKILKDLGVENLGESTKLGRGSSVKFSTDD